MPRVGPNRSRGAAHGTMEPTYRSDPSGHRRARRLKKQDPACPRPLPDRARAEPYRPGADPQLLHHRAHRPRQVHARRPDAPADRRGRRSGRCALSTSTGWTSSASAASRSSPRRSGCPGRPDRRGSGQHAHPEHDRHPGPRRLHLRGLPLARRLRGHGPAGRRRPGHRGPDPRQPLPGDGERPHDHPGAQQDRPAGRAAGEVRRGAGEPDRLRPRRRAAGLRQDRRRRGRAARPGRQGRARRRSASPTRPPAR